MAYSGRRFLLSGDSAWQEYLAETRDARHRLLRETLVRLLHKRAGVSIAGESRYSESVPERIVASQCDVLLLDSPRATLAQVLVDELCVKAPQAQIGLFGMDEAPDSFLNAVHLGVRGYVLKDASSAEIIAAVRAVVIVDHICGKLIPNA